jgi:hypothetical protein
VILTLTDFDDLSFVFWFVRVCVRVQGFPFVIV